MLFRDHARVRLLWLIVTSPLLALRYFPLRARPARPMNFDRVMQTARATLLSYASYM